MRVLETALPGVLIIEPVVHSDARGFFVETYHASRYRESGICDTFVQDNLSRSVRGTLRGLHGQHPHAQAKLVRTIEGEIFAVAVDVRRGSPTYAKFVAAVLSAENLRQLYLPPGFVHGFCVTGEMAQVEYKCSEIYRPEGEFRVAWNDPEIGIPWPIEDPLLSEKDRGAPRLRDLQHRLSDYRPGPGAGG
jgi:dTDP-4-dehydrorhamnose 3,5-epimerase